MAATTYPPNIGSADAKLHSRLRSFYVIGAVLVLIATLPSIAAQDSVGRLRINVNSILLQTGLLANVNSTVTVSNGWWGNWLGVKYCVNTRPDGIREGAKMIGFALRVEGSCGTCDDTALNGLRMICSVGSSSISIAEGNWGSFAGPTYCPTGHHIIGARLKLESQQGNGDDTAANTIDFMCSDSSVISQWTGQWGTWSNWFYCPSGTFVCGAEARYESSQGNGDDTAFNGLRLSCCAPW